MVWFLGMRMAAKAAGVQERLQLFCTVRRKCARHAFRSIVLPYDPNWLLEIKGLSQIPAMGPRHIALRPSKYARAAP